MYIAPFFVEPMSSSVKSLSSIDEASVEYAKLWSHGSVKGASGVSTGLSGAGTVLLDTGPPGKLRFIDSTWRCVRR